MLFLDPCEMQNVYSFGNVYSNAAPFHAFQFIVNKNGNKSNKYDKINDNNSNTIRTNTSVSFGYLYRVAKSSISWRTLLYGEQTDSMDIYISIECV